MGVVGCGGGGPPEGTKGVVTVGALVTGAPAGAGMEEVVVVPVVLVTVTLGVIAVGVVVVPVTVTVGEAAMGVVVVPVGVATVTVGVAVVEVVGVVVTGTAIGTPTPISVFREGSVGGGVTWIWIGVEAGAAGGGGTVSTEGASAGAVLEGGAPRGMLRVPIGIPSSGASERGAADLLVSLWSGSVAGGFFLGAGSPSR
jgi:hypothetical protein